MARLLCFGSGHVWPAGIAAPQHDRMQQGPGRCPDCPRNPDSPQASLALACVPSQQPVFSFFMYQGWCMRH